MKYNELHRLLRKHGCYPLGEEFFGHPAWYSPKTNQKFATSHHGLHEVSPTTLNKILKQAGVK